MPMSGRHANSGTISRHTGVHYKIKLYDALQSVITAWPVVQAVVNTHSQYNYGGLCGVTVEHSLAIQKVAGSNLGRSASR